MDYDKDKAKDILKKEVGWQDYGDKHHESFITKYYQAYILPRKFNIDKRKAHLSSLICANQITRNMALEKLKDPFSRNENEEKEAVDYFFKKIELTLEEFDFIIKLPRREHNEFKSFSKISNQIANVKKMLFLK